MNEQNQTLEKIDIYRILRLILRQIKSLWWLVLLLAAGMGAVQGVLAVRSYVPVYQATATYAASSGVSGVTDIVTNTSYYDTQAREQVVSSFSYIMASEGMIERVKNELGLSYIPGTVTASAVGDTSFFKVTATGNDPELTLQLLEAVLKHYPEAASFVVGTTLLEEVEKPRGSGTPTNELSVRNRVVKGVGIGLVLGFCILVLLALSRKTVESSDDLKTEVNLSCLGTIPYVETKKRRKSENNLISLLNPRVKDMLEASISDLRIKVLRHEKKVKADGKMMLITSTFAGEGKTTVSSNLAISLAKSGKRVILVDADLRNQTIKSRFGIKEPSKGLYELVESRYLVPEEHLIKVEDLPLYLLAGDQRVLSPLEQLESERMGIVLKQIRELADVIILDAPPTGLLVDASILCKHADTTLYVVRHDGPSIHQVVDNIQELQRQNVTMLGYVINGAKTSGHGTYGNYGSYGSYGSYGKKQ